MKIAIVGSRNIRADIPEWAIPQGVTMIYSGAARGIDTSARRYAKKHGILITEILPEYDLYGRIAPLKRNDIIIGKADEVFIFWDGKSRGSTYVIKKCIEQGKPYHLFKFSESKNTFHEIT